MLRFFRLAALVLLMTSWEVAGDTYDAKTRTTYFGCHKNVDAVCSELGPAGIMQTLPIPNKSHRFRYLPQGKPVTVVVGAIPYCTGDGQ
ncbi:hypothetical protein H4Q26_017955 [Puccinia striiformis f. sp. tritici PST-130]|nr:hypothetical protein H4Q26_017669 [Puccinia striiformis f. sp. tritici PST-130]KAI9628779.1 hypothetical protein H4Q26_017955 [Puccinia striiformis f. sp. tritici PST-130]